MARVSALALSGSVYQFFASAQEQLQFAPDPAATVTLDIDESTNAALIADLKANRNAYTLTLVNSVATLQKNGVVVTIAAPSALYTQQSTILTGVPEATLRAAIVALWSGTATAQQQQRALAYALLRLHQAGLI